MMKKIDKESIKTLLSSDQGQKFGKKKVLVLTVAAAVVLGAWWFVAGSAEKVSYMTTKLLRVTQTVELSRNLDALCYAGDGIFIACDSENKKMFVLLPFAGGYALPPNRSSLPRGYTPLQRW